MRLTFGTILVSGLILLGSFSAYEIVKPMVLSTIDSILK